MFGINEEIPFVAINIAVMTVSDTRTEADDRSGDTLAARITDAGHTVAERAIVKDDQATIVAQLREWIAHPEIDAVISTGGTGVTGRDVTPEAFHAVYEKEVAGFGELFRMLSYQKIGTSTIPVTRHRGRCRRHLPVRAARLDRGGQRCVGRYPALPARYPAQALQFRRTDPTPAGASRGGLISDRYASPGKPHRHRYPPAVPASLPAPPDRTFSSVSTKACSVDQRTSLNRLPTRAP